MPNAPYTGGFSPGAQLFAVDGDFTAAAPSGPPVFSSPFKGDTIFSNLPIFIFTKADPWENSTYDAVPLGTYPNRQPWNPNQVDFVIEQEFMVATSKYKAMRLNTPYDSSWSLGWEAQFTDGTPVQDNNSVQQYLAQSILVEESPLERTEAGICRFVRKFAAVPHTRNVLEQFPMTYPGIAGDSGGTVNNSSLRQPFNQNVMSRVQFDFFVFDDLNILSTDLFPAGNRLNATTGIYPDGLILPEFKVYEKIQYSVSEFLRNEISNAGDVVVNSTIPDYTTYKAAINSAEIIAEASTFQQWMGNIYVRKTRFVLIQ